MKNVAVGLALALIVGMTALPLGVSAQPVEVAGPAQVLREGIGKLTAFIAQGGASNPARLEGFLAVEIAPYFDFEYMARFAAGPHYPRFTPDQRQQVESTLRRMFLSAMAQQLLGYRYADVRYLPARVAPGGDEALLSIFALRPGGIRQRLDFRLYRGPEGWKVFDVSSNGQSALVHYRRYFAGVLGGPPVPRRF